MSPDARANTMARGVLAAGSYCMLGDPRVCRQLKQLDSIPHDYTPSQLAQVRHSILAAERRNVVGYLRKGDSLSGMGVKWARRDRADAGRHTHVSEDTPGAAAALTRLSFSACRLRTPHQSSELLAEGPQ